MTLKLPAFWTQTKLGDVVELNYGKGLPRKSRSGTGFPVCGSNGIVGFHEDALVDGPALVVGRKGSIGETHLLESPCWPIDTTYFVSQFHDQPPKFWLHRLRSLPLKSMDRASAIPGLNRDEAYQLTFGLPPLNEQRRIVAKVDALFAHSKKAKESLDRIPKLLDKLKKSILTAAFRGDLTRDWREQNPVGSPTNPESAEALLERIRVERRQRWEEAELAKMQAKGKAPTNDKWKAKYKEPEPVDTTGLPELPTGWCWAPLELITDAVRTIRYGILKPGPNIESGIPYVKVKNIRGGRVLTEDLLRTTREIHEQFKGAELADGDFLISIRGTWGRVAPVPPELAGGNITQDSARIAVNPGVIRDYVMQSLTADHAVRFMNSVAKGMAVKGVNIGDLRRVPVPVPPTAEQSVVIKHLAATLSSEDAVNRIVVDTKRKSDQLNQAILAKAFRGELVPQDPNDEPASVLLERIRQEREAAEAKKPKRGSKNKPTPPRSKPITKQTPDATAALTQLKRALKDKGELSSADAQEATGLSAAQVRPLLKALVKSGEAMKTGAGRGTRYLPADG